MRSFAFSGRLIEVSEILAHEPIDDAIATIVREIGFRSSDYGRSLVDFADGWLDHVDHRTSIVILGDARSNDADPCTDILKQLFERSKRVVWLNPEPRSSWGSGDSEMLRYLPYCHVAAPCRTARDLERTVSRLLTG
ncbi:MAG: VWA domain-containing protein [Candidatus Elarobacter sp.]